LEFSIFCLYKVLFIKMRKRNKQFVIRLSDSEWNHLNELVKYSGQSRESYLRMCINGLVPRPAPSVELVEVTQVLRQIAESINGIAGAVYKQNKMDDSVYMENYEALQKQINEIMLLIRQPINMEEIWQSQKYGQ
jgi:hypothetical protein